MLIKGKSKVEIPPNVMWNQCPTCGETFSSIYSFDFHRTGKYGKDRRCLGIDEMLKKGMAKNSQDRWISSVSDRDVPSRSDYFEQGEG